MNVNTEGLRGCKLLVSLYKNHGKKKVCRTREGELMIQSIPYDLSNMVGVLIDGETADR